MAPPVRGPVPDLAPGRKRGGWLAPIRRQVRGWIAPRGPLATFTGQQVSSPGLLAREQDHDRDDDDNCFPVVQSLGGSMGKGPLVRQVFQCALHRPASP